MDSSISQYIFHSFVSTPLQSLLLLLKIPNSFVLLPLSGPISVAEVGKIITVFCKLPLCTLLPLYLEMFSLDNQFEQSASTLLS